MFPRPPPPLTAQPGPRQIQRHPLDVGLRPPIPLPRLLQPSPTSPQTSPTQRSPPDPAPPQPPSSHTHPSARTDRHPPVPPSTSVPAPPARVPARALRPASSGASNPYHAASSFSRHTSTREGGFRWGNSNPPGPPPSAASPSSAKQQLRSPGPPPTRFAIPGIEGGRGNCCLAELGFAALGGGPRRREERANCVDMSLSTCVSGAGGTGGVDGDGDTPAFSFPQSGGVHPGSRGMGVGWSLPVSGTCFAAVCMCVLPFPGG